MFLEFSLKDVASGDRTRNFYCDFHTKVLNLISMLFMHKGARSFMSSFLHSRIHSYTRPANIYLFKVINRNSRRRCEICSKLTKTPERRHRTAPMRTCDFNSEL